MRLWTTLADVYPALLWAFGLAGLFWLVAVLPYRRLTGTPFLKPAILEEFLFLVFASFLGITIGFISGMSRAPVTGAVVPAVLTLVGTLVGYLFSSTERVTGPRAFNVLCAAFCLLFSFLLATFAASGSRQRWDRHLEALELYKVKYASELKLIELEYEAKLRAWSRAEEDDAEP